MPPSAEHFARHRRRRHLPQEASSAAIQTPEGAVSAVVDNASAAGLGLVLDRPRGLCAGEEVTLRWGKQHVRTQVRYVQPRGDRCLVGVHWKHRDDKTRLANSAPFCRLQEGAVVCRLPEPPDANSRVRFPDGSRLAIADDQPFTLTQFERTRQLRGLSERQRRRLAVLYGLQRATVWALVRYEFAAAGNNA